jgi:hypothetical protein
LETILVERQSDGAVEQAACPECGQPIDVRFCTLCGEKRVEARDYTLGHFLGEALNVIVNLESPLLRSFYALLLRPGRLTADYLAGRRKRYLKPLQVFVLCNLIFFFAQPMTGFNTLTTPLNVHLTRLPYSPQARRMVLEAVGRRKVAPEKYRADFDATIHSQARSLVILMVPLFAAALLPLYWRRRRYFVEHLVFATHFYSVFLLFLLGIHYFGIALLLAGIRLGLVVSVNEDLFFGGIILLASAAYLFAAQRMVYGQPRGVTLLKTLALIVAVTLILQVYRLALFFTAFYTV